MKPHLHFSLKYIYLCILTVISLFLFQNTSYAIEHPSLIFSSSQKAEINARIAAGGPVQQAFYAMKVLKTADEEWERSLTENSFYYAITGDETAKNNALTILSMRTTGEKRFSFPELDDNGNFINGEGRLDYGQSMGCNSLAFGYDMMYSVMNNGLKDNTKTLLIEWSTKLTAFFDKRGWESVGGNFYTGLGACVGNIGLVLEGENSLSSRWVQKAKDGLSTSYFNSSFNSGGDYDAGTTYEVYGAGPQFIFASALERLENVDIVTGKNVMQIWDYFTYTWMANGKYTYYGDNSGMSILIGEYFYILDKHKKKGSDRIPAWLWTWNKVRGTGIAQSDWRLFKDFDYIGIVLWYPQGVVAQSPNEVSSYQKSALLLSDTTKSNVNQGGMASFRNEWGEQNGVTLWLVNRYKWQGHEHYDPNHFLFSAYGEELISNKNAHTYDEDVRGQLSQQNSIMIDKQISDVPVYKTYKTGMGSSLGKFYDFFTSQVGDLLLSDSRYPHSDFSSQSKLHDPNIGTLFWATSEEKVDPIVQADRVILFPKQFSLEPYIIMYDRFNKDNNNHDYTWQSYIVPGHTSINGNGTPADPISFQKGNVNMQMFFIAPNLITKNIVPANGNRQDDLLEMTQTGVKEGRYLTILHPFRSSSSAFLVTVLNQENPTVVQIKSGTNENIIIANTTESNQTFEIYTSDARLLVLDKNDGVINKYMVYRGKNVIVSGSPLVQSDQPVSLVASWDGTIVKGAGMATADSQTIISSFDGSKKTISLKTLYSQFEETGQGGGRIEMINYYYLLMKMNNMSIPETVKVDYNNDGKVDSGDRQIFIQRYKNNE